MKTIYGVDVNAINEKIQKKSLDTSTETQEFEDLITGSGYHYWYSLNHYRY
ncbi:MAG: hypothetical protein ACJZ2C_03140 [Nitrosopumilus sp.]